MRAGEFDSLQKGFLGINGSLCGVIMRSAGTALPVLQGVYRCSEAQLSGLVPTCWGMRTELLPGLLRSRGWRQTQRIFMRRQCGWGAERKQSGRFCAAPAAHRKGHDAADRQKTAGSRGCLVGRGKVQCPSPVARWRRHASSRAFPRLRSLQQAGSARHGRDTPSVVCSPASRGYSSCAVRLRMSSWISLLSSTK